MMDYDIRHGRTYMYFRGKPVFPFGHGLSYTQFKYSRLKVRKEGDNYVFRFRLKNVGPCDGEEVVQLYARFPGDDAACRLRGFDRIALTSGEQREVELVIPADDLTLWNAESHAFSAPKGRTRILIGASSADIRLKKGIRL
jgi:beta-glucosidase